MTVGMAAGQRVFAASEGIEVLVEEEAAGQLAVTRIAGAQPGEEQILRHGVGLVPHVAGEVLAGEDGRFLVRHGFGRQVRQDNIGGAGEDVESRGVMRENMRVGEADGEFVVDVTGEAVILIELTEGLESCRVAANHAVDLGVGGGVARDGVHPGQRGDPLPEGARGRETIGGVPATELVAGRGQPLAKAKRAQQTVVTEVEQHLLALLELLLGRAGVEIDLRVMHLVEQRRAEGRRCRAGRCRRGGGESGRGHAAGADGRRCRRTPPQDVAPRAALARFFHGSDSIASGPRI